jgi:hypothetical protein
MGKFGPGLITARQQMQTPRFNGEHGEHFGPVISGEIGA